MFNFDFDDIDREKLKKYILIGIIIFFGVIGLFLIFPFLFYTIVFLGVVIPSYILYKNYKKNNYEK
jgi:NADH:ubiquinone oxidoreductase subunit 4 (subunit M)